MLNIGAYRKFKKVMPQAHPLPLPITILYLMSGCGRSCRKFKKICNSIVELYAETVIN